MEYIMTISGLLLLIYGLLTGLGNWYIFFYNFAHVHIIRDGKHASFILLVPTACILIGSHLAEPLIPGAAILILLNGELALPLYLILVAIYRSLRWVVRLIPGTGVKDK